MDAPPLIFGICVSAVFLFVRYRWPAVPKPLATFGMCLGVGLAIWSFTPIPIGLALSIVLNAAFAIAILDYLLLARPAKNRSVGKLPINSVSREITRALNSAYNGGYERRPDQLRSHRAALLSVFITLRKRLKLVTPNVDADDLSIEVGLAYLNEIRPFVAAGHIEAAQAAAAHFVAQNQPGVIQDG